MSLHGTAHRRIRHNGTVINPGDELIAEEVGYDRYRVTTADGRSLGIRSFLGVIYLMNPA